MLVSDHYKSRYVTETKKKKKEAVCGLAGRSQAYYIWL